jgi:hypothetical protein
MGRGSHKFLEHWHHRSVDLDDGRVLAWVAMLDREPGRAECFRVDDTPIHPTIGAELLRASGHADGRLVMPHEAPTGGLRG